MPQCMGRRDLREKLVVITGGAQGIGRHTASQFLKEGARVVIADIDAALAEQTAKTLSAGGTISAYGLDVTSLEAFTELVETIERLHGPIDLLINNAGIMPIGGFVEQSPHNDRKQIEVNIFGVINGMRAVLPKMERRGRGHVINIASMAGKMGIPYAAVYSATKHAVIGLTEAVRTEYRRKGISFTYVMPAPVNTALISGSKNLLFPPLVQPEEVAAAVIKAAKKGTTSVFVPKSGLISEFATLLLPKRLQDWVGKFVGVEALFRDHDAEARKAYVARTTEDAELAAKPKMRVIN